MARPRSHSWLYCFLHHLHRVSSSYCPPSNLESRLQTSAEEMRWITSTSARADGPGACTGVLCDLQKRGSYFHHGTTPPHWPCNGALPLLDWLARLKAALSRRLRRCWWVWGSSLVPCTSANECVYVFAYAPLSLQRAFSVWWGSQGIWCT